jgi:hypothetical protein
MPWLPRHATAKACHGQGMPRPRHAMAKACAAKACHSQGMLCQGNAMGCQGLPRPRHVLPRKCHGLPRLATAKAMPWLPRHVLPRKCHELPRLATAMAMPCAAKACHGQGNAMCCQGLPRQRQCHDCQGLPRQRQCHDCQGMPRPRQCHGLPRPRHGLPTTRTKSTTLSVQRSSLRVQTGIIVKILFVWDEGGGGDESKRHRAESQWIVAARPLCHLQYPVAYLSRLQRILLVTRWELYFKAAHAARPPRGLHQRHVPSGARRPLLRVGNRATGTRIASSPDSDLEAFSHNPAHGSFAPLAFQPSAMTNCANQRFLSY